MIVFFLGEFEKHYLLNKIAGKNSGKNPELI